MTDSDHGDEGGVPSQHDCAEESPETCESQIQSYLDWMTESVVSGGGKHEHADRYSEMKRRHLEEYVDCSACHCSHTVRVTYVLNPRDRDLLTVEVDGKQTHTML